MWAPCTEGEPQTNECFCASLAACASHASLSFVTYIQIEANMFRATSKPFKVASRFSS